MLAISILVGLSEDRPHFATLPPARHKFVVIAHRGDHLDLPENTLSSLKEAIRDGADFCEIDLQTTKDGHIVLMHDGTVNRMTDSTGTVSSHTLAEVAKMKVIDRRTAGVKTEHVPTFEEELKVARGKICFYLDVKNARATMVRPLLEKYGMLNQVIAYVYTPAQYREWKKAMPEVPCMSGVPKSIKSVLDFNRFWDKTPLELFDSLWPTQTDDDTRLLSKLGVQFWIDIQGQDEGPEKWQGALNRGVTGLQTDHPKQLIAFLESKGIR